MTHFNKLGLPAQVLSAITDLGYETPTPVQAQCIPALLEGKNLIGQAQTGTGKTAAFSLPLLSMIDVTLNKPQAIVLAPTRELAIQVAEAFQSYAKNIKGFHVLPVYGGSDYRPQLKALQRGVHVIVGTPGRVMDHIRRKSLSLDNIKTLVLDEADEMLKMGFIDDVKWVLDQIPHEHQIALFSATMPRSIQEVAKKHMHNPVTVKIEAQKKDVKTIKQYYSLVSQKYKIEALTRFLEAEDFSAAIIFTRTKVASSELAEKLEARGHRAAAINGDMVQSAREKVIARLKRNSLDIIVATEVAARGLDIDRIGYVINYDMPFDVESYVHRIGRTGRAGREGKALVFVTRRERRMLNDIERVTKQEIKELHPPSLTELKQKRMQAFKDKLRNVIAAEDLSASRAVLDAAMIDGMDLLDIAAACIHLNTSTEETNNAIDEIPKEAKSSDRYERESGRSRRARSEEGGRRSSRFNDDGGRRKPAQRGRKSREMGREEGMTRCRMELGYDQGLTPSDVVGLIANTCSVDRKVVGQINIFDRHCLLDVSDKVVKKVVKQIKDHRLKRKMTKMAIVKSS